MTRENETAKDLQELTKAPLADFTESKTLKYVIIEHGGKMNAIIFPDEISHALMLTFCSLHYGFKGLKSLKGAGFCKLDWKSGTLKVSVWGESESIKNSINNNCYKACWTAHKGRDEIFIATSICSGGWDYMYPYNGD